MNIKHATLYTAEGQKIAEIENGTIKAETLKKPKVSAKRIDSTRSFTAKMELDRLTALSLIYGMKITNNWLKMHGGIMTRRSGKRKKGKRF